jgi:glycogen debranching enzyme
MFVLVCALASTQYDTSIHTAVYPDARLQSPTRWGSPLQLSKRRVHPSIPSLNISDALCSHRKPFGRTRFLGHPFTYDGFHEAWCDLTIQQAGAFEYLVEFRDTCNEDDPGSRRQSPVGYFVVDPCLRRRRLRSSFHGNDDDMSVLHMDSICIQTLVPKWMGLFRDWDAVLKEASDAGYNMIHFVPMQQRGASNSPYSISNQLALSSDLFENASLLSDKEAYAQLDEVLGKMAVEYGLIAVSDVVWNHTAHNSEWLLIHPEAGRLL